MIDSSIEQSMR